MTEKLYCLQLAKCISIDPLKIEFASMNLLSFSAEEAIKKFLDCPETSPTPAAIPDKIWIISVNEYPLCPKIRKETLMCGLTTHFVLRFSIPCALCQGFISETCKTKNPILREEPITRWVVANKVPYFMRSWTGSF